MHRPEQAAVQSSSTSCPDVGQSRDRQRPRVALSDLEGRWLAAWHLTRTAVLRWVTRNARRWYTLRSVVCNVRGHIQALRAIEHQSVDLGPAVQRSPDGRLLPCSRTVAHSCGIRSLETKYPWADLVDVQVFLLGFDAGARWADSNAGSASSIAVAACDTSNFALGPTVRGEHESSRQCEQEQKREHGAVQESPPSLSRLQEVARKTGWSTTPFLEHKFGPPCLESSPAGDVATRRFREEFLARSRNLLVALKKLLDAPDVIG